MTSLKIKLLLPLLFGLLVVFGLAQGGYAIKELSDMEAQINEIGRGRLPRSVALGEMQLAHAHVRRAYANLLAARDDAGRQEQVKVLLEARKARDEAFGRFEAMITRPDTRTRFDEIVRQTDAYRAIGEQVVALAEINELDAAAQIYTGIMRTTANELDKAIGAMVDFNSELAEASVKSAEEDAGAARFWMLVVSALATVVGLGAALFSNNRIARPIHSITEAMRNLAANDTATSIPYAGRHDEIGEMAGATEVFRQNALERARLEAEANANRSLSETERRAREEQKAREAAEVQFAVDQLADGLARLSDGNVTVRLNTRFADHLDMLRDNFNGSVAKLQGALQKVGENARNIDAGAREILSAANDLSRRTEQQAASVEETAAALEEVTTGVKDAAVRADEAGTLVARTRQSAEQSGQIVGRAIDAMTAIERSSGEIANIIGVIDEIAFQTNLLALNAGVEAARAGEAGKGFAVVAQEVRELAQRSAQAAKEIKALINTSGEQVRAGVELVSKTGAALGEIVEQVQMINGNVSAIVTSAREQSTGLQEINLAVNQMDQGTQQNAAMVEQSTAASHGLAQQAASLNALLGQFHLGHAGQAPRAAHASGGMADQTAPASPARALARRVGSAFQGSAALKQDPEWAEF